MQNTFFKGLGKYLFWLTQRTTMDMPFTDAYLSWMILFADHLHFPLSLCHIWRRDHIPYDSIYKDKQRLMMVKSRHQLGGSINIGSVGLFLLCFGMIPRLIPVVSF